MAIDPGLTYDLPPANTQTLRLIQLGQGPDRLDSTDMSDLGSGFSALVPAAHLLEIALAYHFSMLPLCTENGATIPKSEQDDPVCKAPNGADRNLIHGQVIAAVIRYLGLN